MLELQPMGVVAPAFAGCAVCPEGLHAVASFSRVDFPQVASPAVVK